MRNTVASPLCCLLAAFLFSMLFLASCSEADPDSDPSFQLTFSSDTIIFDTVFTTVGSYTQALKVYNNNPEKILISRILLKNSSDCFFINIDGQPSTSISDIELDAGDSLFLFVKVRIDPVNQNLPLVVTDQVEFVTNGNYQYVDLVAWGQDAYYHTPDHFQADFPSYSLISGDVTWPSDKPHVVYGWLVVDSAARLTIPSSTKVYFHSNSLLMIYKEGALRIDGTADEPVLLRNDRLDPFYRNLPGQWNGIWISEGALPCTIQHAVIENANLAIQVDQPASFSVPQLLITNTEIRNMSLGAISGNGTWIDATNVSISACGSYALALNGGIFSFRHLSVGNWWASSVRSLPSVVVKNYFIDGNQSVMVEPTSVFFGNTVIYGNQSEELLIDKHPDNGTFNYMFDHCLLKTSINTLSDPGFNAVVVNTDPLFLKAETFDLHPDTLSPLINAGIDLGVPTDLEGFQRDALPDIGAFEYR